MTPRLHYITPGAQTEPKWYATANPPVDRWDKKWDTEFVTGSCLTVFVGLPVVLQDRHHGVGVLRLEHGVLPRLFFLHCASAAAAAAGARCGVSDSRVRVLPLPGDPHCRVHRDYHKSFAHVPLSSPLLVALLMGRKDTHRPAYLCGPHAMRANTHRTAFSGTHTLTGWSEDWLQYRSARPRPSLIGGERQGTLSIISRSKSEWLKFVNCGMSEV